MAKRRERDLNPIRRNNFDFEMLFLQQVEMQRLTNQTEISLVQLKSKYEEKPYSGTSLIFLTVTNPIRKACIQLVLNSTFDYFILSVILANCVTLVLDDFMVNNTWSVKTDTCFLVIFTIESFLKIIAVGFFIGKNTYLRDAWNILDFVVVILGWMGYFLGGQNITMIRSIRILRPLRTINSIPEMKILTVSIIKSLPLLFDIFLLLVLFLLIFALVGTQIYGGLFSQQCFTLDGQPTGDLCYLDPKCSEYELNCGNSGCSENQYCWNSNQNPTQGVTSFDNIPLSLCTVFVAITMEGWSDVMRMGRSVLNQKFLNDIYFYVLLLVGAFFMIKLTVAAICVKFEKTSGEQKEQIVLIMDDKKKKSWMPLEPEDLTDKGIKYCWYRFRLGMYKIIMSRTFGFITIMLILINTGVMASQYYKMTKIHSTISENINMALNLCFCVEMIMKLIGLGLRGYVDESFNIFDGILVILGMIEIIFLSGTKNLRALLVFRAFRLLRIFKLARRWKKLRMLLAKLINAAKSIAYLGLLSMISVFIFTLLGKQLFKGQLLDQDGQIPRANFETLFWSFVTVFDILTSENWNGVMYTGVGSYGWGSFLYFLALLVVGNYILLNLFLAILIAQFENEDEENEEDEDEDDLEEEIVDNLERHDTNGYQQVVIQSRDKRRKQKMLEKIAKNSNKDPLELSGKSFFIFSPENPIRVFLKNCLLHPYFDSSIYALITLSCVILALDEPKKTPLTERFLGIISYVVLALFTLEFLFKSAVFGFLKGERCYIKNSWNILDLLIILMSYLDIILAAFAGGAIKLSFLRAFRALRALRPLRMVSHNERMKKMVTSVIQAVPAVLNVMLITVLFYIIFGILGIIFFNGLMYYCTDSLIVLESECVGVFVNENGEVVARDWQTLSYNFDNIFNAMLTLFDVSTLEAWPSYLLGIVDGVSQGHAMVRDYNPIAALFYIAYIFITNFFIMNLYLGAVIKKFNEIQQELDGTEFLTAEQKEWIRTQKLLILVQPRIRYLRPESNFFGFFYDMIMNYKFEMMIQTVIVMNVLFMSLFSYPIDTKLNDLLALANYVFVAIFTMEMIVKILGLGLRYYFSNNWNRFDCFVTILSLITLQSNFGISNATVLRAFRMARLFRVVKIFKGFQVVFNTLILSAPSLINVGTLLLLLWFVYGVAGMYLFGSLDLSVTQILNDQQNFNTFYNAISLLFQCITGENWDLIMRDCMGNYGCSGTYEQCGNPGLAIVYWISYTILGQYFFLNMFIAVILENFNEEDEDITNAGLTEKDLKRYQKAWCKFAPFGEDAIDVQCLPELLQRLDSPLGFKGQNLTNMQILTIIHAMKIKEHNNRVNFAELMWTLASAISGADLSTAPNCEAVRSILKQLPKILPTYETQNGKVYESSKNFASKCIAGKIILTAWREYRKRIQQHGGNVIEKRNNMPVLWPRK
ncbi:hypothetical protein SteCoe_32973 [Stentor coeruleus]|uniref:Ion transport domain-containing protein n=1 Tax=Stentor coeruleus TaxID=5963 RepID=A0A1R2AY84_9CILI|nr:hypothetical protein SteCoe_32973 [Stentor coeruleus]